MSETPRIDVNTDGMRESLQEVRDELNALVEKDITPLAEGIQGLFREMGQSISSELAEATEKGRVSIRGLVNSVLEDLSRLAAEELVRKPIDGVLAGIFGGARAGGGPVSRGQAYLVGERGPELFTPASAGRISGVGGRAVNVTVNMTSGSGDRLGRSDAQLAATIARALGKAGRNA